MIADWTRKYIGLPYEEFARGPNYFDCWGLIAHIYKVEFNIDLWEGMALEEYTSRDEQIDRLETYLPTWDHVEDPEVGDGILFLIGARRPHCGIYVGDGKMLHSIKGVSSCIQKLDNFKWKPRFEGYYRYSHSNS